MALRGRRRRGLGLHLGLGITSFLTGLIREKITTITNFILKEDGFYLLQENGDKLIL